jgi:hypothetical protein
VFGEPARDAFLRREPTKRRGRIAQRGAVFVIPGDEQRLAVAIETERPSAFTRDDADALRRVEIVDPAQRGQLETGLPRIRVELQRSRADDGVIGDLLGRLEIPLDVRLLDELHVTEIREPFTADRVARRVDADVEVEPGQVAKRVRVFRAGQPPHRHAPGIAGVFRFVLRQGRAHPLHRPRALVVGWKQLRLVAGRHLARLQHLGDLVPLLPIRADGGLGRQLDQALDADVTLLFGAAVAFEAVLLQGLRRLEAAGRGRGSGGATGSRSRSLALGRHHRCSAKQERRAKQQACHRMRMILPRPGLPELGIVQLPLVRVASASCAR